VANLGKAAYNAWREFGGLGTILAREYEALPWGERDQWDMVAEKVVAAANEEETDVRTEEAR